MRLQSDWIDWWREHLRVVREGGFISMLEHGVLYRLQQTEKRVVVVLAFRGALGQNTQHPITVAVLKRLQFRVEVAKDAFVDDAAEFRRRHKTLVGQGTTLISETLLQSALRAQAQLN